MNHSSQTKELALSARNALDQCQFRLALELYDRLVSLDPDDPRWRRRRLDAAHLALIGMPDAPDRFSEALGRIEQVIAESPGDAVAHFELGYGLLVLASDDHDLPDRVARATKAFDRARSLAPGNIGGWWGLTIIAEIVESNEKAMFEKAIEVAHIATQEIPEDSRAWLLLATVILSRGLASDIPRATRALNQSVGLDPENQEALLLLGDVHLATRNHQAAISTYSQLVQVEPRSWLATIARAQLDRLRDDGPKDCGTASGVRIIPTDDDPPPDDSGGANRLTIPPWIPSFRALPTLRTELRKLLFAGLD